MRTITLNFVIGAWLLASSIQANTEIPIFSPADIFKSLNDLLQEMHLRPKKLISIRYSLKLRPGFYAIMPQEKFFSREYMKLKSNGLMDVQNVELQIVADYPWPHHEEILFLGSLKKALLWFDRELKNGLQLTQDIVYSVKSDQDFFNALEHSMRNRQHTVIQLLHCKQKPCVNSSYWRKKILNLKMLESDGMRLRIQSRYHSLDKDKWSLFNKDLQTFIQDS